MDRIMFASHRMERLTVLFCQGFLRTQGLAFASMQHSEAVEGLVDRRGKVLAQNEQTCQFASDLWCSTAGKQCDVHCDIEDCLHHCIIVISGGEEVTLPAMLPVMTGTPGSTKWAGPDLGHHTEEVLKEQLNLDDASLSKLRQQKVI